MRADSKQPATRVAVSACQKNNMDVGMHIGGQACLKTKIKNDTPAGIWKQCTARFGWLTNAQPIAAIATGWWMKCRNRNSAAGLCFWSSTRNLPIVITSDVTHSSDVCEVTMHHATGQDFHSTACSAGGTLTHPPFGSPMRNFASWLSCI